LFHADSAFGVFPSERSPHLRLPGVSAVACPACRFRESHWPSRSSTQPDPKIGFRVLPQASPLPPHGCLARRAPEAPLGFLPLRGRRCRPWPALPRASSHALVRRDGYPSRLPAPRSLDQSTPRLTTRAKRPSQGFAPQHPWHSAAPRTRAYGFAGRLAARHRAVQVASHELAWAS
jgi:hypothetical protein